MVGRSLSSLWTSELSKMTHVVNFEMPSWTGRFWSPNCIVSKLSPISPSCVPTHASVARVYLGQWCKKNERANGFVLFFFFFSISSWCLGAKKHLQKGEGPGRDMQRMSGKSWKFLRSHETAVTMLPFSCCPLAFFLSTFRGGEGSSAMTWELQPLADMRSSAPLARSQVVIATYFLAWRGLQISHCETIGFF